MTTQEKIVAERLLVAPTCVGHEADHIDDSARYGHRENGGGPRRIVIVNDDMEIPIPITRFRLAVADEAHEGTVVAPADLDRECCGV